MENIIFTNKGGSWTAEFTASGDFNLHIEKKSDDRGDMFFYQKTVYDGAYARIKDVKFDQYTWCFDADFSGVVYPKYIKIESSVEPKMAVIQYA